ncbi:hypothetical protein [Salinibacterium sp. NK8237]|uniref:hypothetical protein n=1 Tax=Salinibacterium sp. NK8237 TaxID=2792038 RepID=UPI0018CC88A9|nr:hypothetical protein [Salinibacterium sp. NK8237]MBH0129643.1 hypothetical protein [Salinibacterium sp. NK8237]
MNDPLCGDDELAGLGFTPYHLGEAVDTAVVQPEHAEHRGLMPADLPGIKNFADGRCVSSVEQWPGATYRVTGKSLARDGANDQRFDRLAGVGTG